MALKLNIVFLSILYITKRGGVRLVTPEERVGIAWLHRHLSSAHNSTQTPESAQAMSYEGQAHHPHVRGGPPNADRISLGEGHVPAGLQLVQAHWFVRHGERSRTCRFVLAGPISYTSKRSP